MYPSSPMPAPGPLTLCGSSYYVAPEVLLRQVTLVRARGGRQREREREGHWSRIVAFACELFTAPIIPALFSTLSYFLL